MSYKYVLNILITYNVYKLIIEHIIDYYWLLLLLLLLLLHMLYKVLVHFIVIIISFLQALLSEMKCICHYWDRL